MILPERNRLDISCLFIKKDLGGSLKKALEPSKTERLAEETQVGRPTCSRRRVRGLPQAARPLLSPRGAGPQVTATTGWF